METEKSAGMAIELEKLCQVPSVFPSLDEDAEENHGDWLLVITKPTLGEGDETLGKALMESFFAALMLEELPPAAVIFLNSGVRLCCANSSVLEDLCALERRGVGIFVSAACVDYYQLRRELCVGNLIAMSQISARIARTMRVVTF